MANLKGLTVNDSGFIRIPTGDGNSRPSSTQEGQLRFNQSNNFLENFNGSVWTNANISYPNSITDSIVFRADASDPNSYPGVGNTWVDIVNNNNAQLSGSVNYVSAQGGYFGFNGTDYGSVGSLPGVSGFCTVSAVVRADISSEWGGVLFGFGTDTSSTQAIYYWGDKSNKQFGFNTWNNDSWGFNDADKPGNVMDGEWHHIIAIFNRNDTTSSRLYVDGIEMLLSQVKNSTNNPSVSSNFGIAYNGWESSSQTFQGDIGNVQIFDRELTESEARTIFETDASRFGISTRGYGSHDNPGQSAREILLFYPSAPSGFYYIIGDKINNGLPLKIIGDMKGYNGQDGGWTLVHSVVGANNGYDTENILFRNETFPTRLDDYSIIGYADEIKQPGTWEFMIEAQEQPYSRYEYGGTYTAGSGDSFQDSTPRTGSFGRNVDFSGVVYGNSNFDERVPWINQGAGSPSDAIFTTFPGSPNWWGTITEGGSNTRYTTGPWLKDALSTPDYKWVWVR